MIEEFNLLEKAMDESQSLGATSAEAFLLTGQGLSIKVFKGSVEEFTYSEERGIGMRVFVEDRPGRAYVSDLGLEAVRKAAVIAVSNARVTPPDKHRELPGRHYYPASFEKGLLLGDELEIYAGPIEETETEAKIQFAMEMEKSALDFDERISGVETVAYIESEDRVLLANTNGFRAGFRSTGCYGYLSAIAAEDGESQTGFGFTAGRSFTSLKMEEAAREAASKAVGMLGARPVETARVPVLLDNLSTGEILAVVASALSGEAVAKGRSFLAGKEGRKIASESVTIIDDGLMKEGFGTSPFDAEGVATSKKKVVENGELKSYLHNCYTASRMGKASTGNAGRSSYSSPVGVTPSNIYLLPGEDSPDELRAGMGTGFEVLELQGVHVGFNPVSGEVSVGARGYWIEKGKRVQAVREVTVAGTLDELLGGVIGIGNDLRFTPMLGGLGASSMLVEGLTVSGK